MFKASDSEVVEVNSEEYNSSNNIEDSDNKIDEINKNNRLDTLNDIAIYVLYDKFINGTMNEALLLHKKLTKLFER